MEPGISVIIPVYNTGEYLRESIESVLSQSMSDIEVIIVNDGSTDSSPAIIKSIASSDSRVRVLNQANGGASVARNNGLDHATGRYIYFMDSDDVLEPGALVRCYEKCELDSLDLLFFDASIFGDKRAPKGFRSDYYIHTAGLDDRVWDGPEIAMRLMSRNKFRASSCLHLVRRTLIEKHRLRFLPGIIIEDELFAPQLYIHAHRVGFVPEVLYRRRLRHSSVMTTRFGERNIRGYLTVVREIEKLKGGLAGRKAAVLGKQQKLLLRGMLFQARMLPFSSRWSLAAACMRNYRSHTTIKSILALLFPFALVFKRLPRN